MVNTLLTGDLAFFLIVSSGLDSQFAFFKLSIFVLVFIAREDAVKFVNFYLVSADNVSSSRQEVRQVNNEHHLVVTREPKFKYCLTSQTHLTSHRNEMERQL